MKKILLIAVAIGGLTIHLNAKRIAYGPKAGGNFSFLSNLDKLQLQNTSTEKSVFDIARTAFHWGAYYEYVLSSRLSMGTELVYTRLGSIYEDSALKLSYISMPVWFMWYPFGIQQGFSLYLGPALNFLWHAAPINLIFFIQEKHVDPFEGAIVGGLRYLLAWGVSIDLRYNWGLTDIFDFQPPDQRLPPLDSVQLTNHCLQLSISYDLASIGRR